MAITPSISDPAATLSVQCSGACAVLSLAAAKHCCSCCGPDLRLRLKQRKKDFSMLLLLLLNDPPRQAQRLIRRRQLSREISLVSWVFNQVGCSTLQILAKKFWFVWVLSSVSKICQVWCCDLLQLQTSSALIWLFAGDKLQLLRNQER